MDFQNTMRSRSRFNNNNNDSTDQRSQFDPSETKPLRNPRVTIEKNRNDFIPRVIDSNSFNFDNLNNKNESLPHEEDVSAIGSFISRNKIAIGIVIVLLIISIIVIYLWYYYNKKSSSNMFKNKSLNEMNNINNTNKSGTISSLKINEPAKVTSLSDDSESEKEIKKIKKKNKSNKSNIEKIKVPSRKSVLEKSKEELNNSVVLDKNVLEDDKHNNFIFTKNEDIKHKSNINLTRDEDSDEESSKFYNN